MPLEYEYVFKNYDKKQVIHNIKKIGGKKIGHYIFRVIVMNHPLKTPNTYIRIRDEGYRITMTYKYKESKGDFSDESEINIDNFDMAIKILIGIGCTKKYYYEKMREIWNIKNTEIIFDINPGTLERMEIESPTQKELEKVMNQLNVQMYKLDKNIDTDTDTMKLFGFTISSNLMDLTFNNVKKELGKLVVKNKTLFNKIVAEQKKQYILLKK